MAIVRSSRSRVLRRGPKRATNWISSATPGSPATVAAATAVLSQSFASSQIVLALPSGGTIVRTRGTLWVSSDQEAATEEPVGAFGMMVVREQARAAGIASLPTPVTEAFDDGFFVHIYWQAGMHRVSGVGITGTFWKRYDFDSKAQRKLTPDDAIVVTMENSHATDGCVFVTGFRMLLKTGVSG